jgi:hypothetical protein
MVYTFEVSESNNKNKKLKVVIYNDGVKIKTFHVGDKRYYDYISYYKNDGASVANERRRLYLLRHHKDDNNNFLTRAYWSKFLLWGKPTLKEAIDSINLNR